MYDLLGDMYALLHSDPEADAEIEKIAGLIIPQAELLDYHTNLGIVEPPPGLPIDVINQTVRYMNDEGIGRFRG